MFWVLYKEMYLERLQTRHPDSDHPAQARRVLDRFTSYCSLTGRKLHEITNLDLDAYIARRTKDLWRGAQIGNRTVNNEIALLNTVFGFAGPRAPRGPGRKYLGLINEPPFAEALPELDNNPVVVTVPQLMAFIEATKFARVPCIEGCQPQNFWITALVLGLVSSLRRRAMLNIPRPDDYTLLELQQIVLPAKWSKTRREQRIALGNADVVEIVASMPTKPGEPLLPWKKASGQPMTPAYFNRILCEFQRAAGIPEEQRIKLKHLRSTAATETLEQFGDGVAKSKLGHSPNTNTLDRHYKGRRVSDVDRQASEHLAQLVLPLMEFKPRIFGEEAS